MKPFFKLSTRKTTGLMVILALSAAAMAACNWHTPTRKTEAPVVAAVHNTAPPTPLSQRNVIGGESITLTPRGFQPVEISRGPGRFVLNINNRSGVHEVTFVLTHEAGNRMREMQFARGKLSSRELLDLPPG
ncbi:MAG: hypothetical protein ACRD8U_22105, partial [Pyrinomonadaceae bacterium]